MGLQPRGAGQSHARVLRLGRAFLMTLVRMWRLRNSVLSADYDNRAFDSPLWLQRHWQRTRYSIVMGMLDGRDNILDVGCGTGLCGALLSPYARRLVGVDLSDRMLDQARERNIYDELVKGELTAYLDGCRDAYDVIEPELYRFPAVDPRTFRARVDEHTAR